MSTPQTPVTSAAAAPPKTSLLKHIGSILGKLATVFSKDVVPAEPLIAKGLEAMFPQFAPAIATGDGLFTKIAKQILVTQTSAAAVANAPSGDAKLQAVTSAVGSEIDAWIKNLFPGASTLSSAQKSGLVQAVYNAIDGQPASAATPTT